MKSLFVVNVRLPDEYKAWVNDIVKTFVLLTTVHVLQYMTKNGTSRSAGALFSSDFWKLVIFVIIGFSAYYLVVRKLIRFRYLGEREMADGQSPHSVSFSPFQVFGQLRTWLKNKL